jgi:uncharacterized protein (DUF1015 family)
MATDQLHFWEYDRVVVPLEPVDKDILFRQLDPVFHIQKSHTNQPVQPQQLHTLGMCLEGEWYDLQVSPHLYAHKNEADSIDAAILQEHVLAPIFGILDPGTDSRLKCAGGEKALEEIGIILEANPTGIVFTLCPLNAEQLIAVADAGRILPPKSTWIIPKVPYGLLMQQH